MIYKFVSSKTVVTRLIDSVNGSDWIANCPMYINDCCQEIGNNYYTTINFTKGDTTDKNDKQLLEVKNHLVKLPDNIIELIRVEYNGCRLPISKNISNNALTCDNYTTIDTTCNDFYILNPPYIKTSFETGKVKLFYKCSMTDGSDEGYLMIPDQAEYKEAIFWYILKKLTLNGEDLKLKNLSFSYLESQYSIYKEKARNKLKQFNRDEREIIAQLQNSINLSNIETIIMNR